MHTNLPIIISAGYFYSADKFSNPLRYPVCSVTKLRTVMDYEIELFTADEGISHVNGKSYPITKGSLLIVKPGDKRQSTLHFSALFLHFSTSDPAINDLVSSMSGFHMNLDYEKWEVQFREICELASQFDQDGDIYISTKVLSFLCDLKKEIVSNSCENAGTPNYSIVGMAIEYMKNVYMEPVTVDQIAKHCGVSVSYLHKLFLDTTHTTPNKYLLNIRLMRAELLLSSTNMLISEVAIKCGFGSQTYFSDRFRKKYNITPKEFRNSSFSKR